MLRQWPAYARWLDPTSRLPAVDPWLLRRRQPTIPQTGLAPQERRANVRGAFQIEDPQGIIKGRQILLMDDVFTTGATAGACVQALKSKGRAGGVDVLTLAGSS
jgi:predicted amidophosphoribosyltransferase